MTDIAAELQDIGLMLIALRAQQADSKIETDIDVSLAFARREQIRWLRRRFHLLSKTVDDVDRARVQRWEAKQKRDVAGKAYRKGWKPSPRTQGRKGSGRYTNNYLVENV